MLHEVRVRVADVRPFAGARLEFGFAVEGLTHLVVVVLQVSRLVVLGTVNDLSDAHVTRTSPSGYLVA